MKNNKSTYIYCLLALLVSFVTSCTGNDEDNETRNNPEDGFPITAAIGTRTIPDNLTCTMYVFWTPTAGSDYVYKEEVTLLNADLPYKMKFLNHELADKNYRFLFVATPKENSKISVINSAGAALATGNPWSDVLVRTADKVLDQHYYYGILDKTGNQILSTGTINGNLKRIVGQIVLDIFRIDGSLANPMGIKSDLTASVLDRVHQIDIQYTNLTKDIGFDADGNIIEVANWDTPYSATILPERGDTLQVYVPQVEKGIEVASQGVNGSARILGVYGLFSSPKIRAKYEFTYFDTTPLCGNTDGGNHSKECYDNSKTVVLNLPQLSDNEHLLSILPNNYTVNKAGIQYDRIIDVGVNGSVSFNTVWEIKK